MRKIEVVNPDRRSTPKAFAAPHCRLEGSGRCFAASPPDASIWMSTLELDEGAALRWDPSHGDEALYVESGELVVDGRICGAGGAIVIEARACPTVEVRVTSRVVHMGARDGARDGGVAVEKIRPGPSAGGTDRNASAFHLVGPRGTFEAIEPGRETRFFADATCPHCSLWLLYTARTFAYESPVHSHSQDELIHVLRGEVRIGSLVAGPGASVFIAADQPYQFRSGPEGFAFLNYRRAASLMTIRPTGEQIIEAGAATGMTPVAASAAPPESDRVLRSGEGESWLENPT